MITELEKQKIFALYRGQKVGVYKQTTHTTYISPVHPEGTNLLHLLLKPLSSVTDEDAIEVAKMFEHDEKWYTPECGRHLIDYFLISCNDIRMNLLKIIKLIDFFRSHGYALPAFGHSVEELVQEGVFKLIEL